ncbi:MAG: ATPase [Betaproteobacteria bacterium]|nr:MAG: ATPase [Betaproteobacteria bacterium]
MSGATRSSYRDRIFDDPRHDPYQARGKYPEPTVCESCGAVFHRGRWQWASPPEDANRERCPACRRIRDRLPAGVVTLSGAFLGSHRDEVLQLLRHEARQERDEHPMNRIMDVNEAPDEIVVTTTDIHTPRRIGNALERAYHGKLETRYGEDEYTLHVTWER